MYVVEEEYTNLTNSKPAEIRDEIRNKWQDVTLAELLFDLNESEVHMSVPIQNAIEKIVKAYKRVYKKMAEEVKIH